MLASVPGPVRAYVETVGALVAALEAVSD